MLKKNLPIIKKNSNSGILDGSWLIQRIENDQLFIFRNKPVKKVKFSENIEVNTIKDNKIVKSNDLMNKYGEPPSKKHEFFENYLMFIMNNAPINTNKYALTCSLRLLNLYHFFMNQLIYSHYVISKDGKKMVYSKRTIVRKSKIDYLTKFIYEKTDLEKHICVISKFIRKYCVK